MKHVPNKSTKRGLRSDYSSDNDVSKTIQVLNENPYMDQTSLGNTNLYIYNSYQTISEAISIQLNKQHDDIKSMMLRRKEEELIKDIRKHKEHRDKQRQLRTI